MFILNRASRLSKKTYFEWSNALNFRQAFAFENAGGTLNGLDVKGGANVKFNIFPAYTGSGASSKTNGINPADALGRAVSTGAGEMNCSLTLIPNLQNNSDIPQFVRCPLTSFINSNYGDPIAGLTQDVDYVRIKIPLGHRFINGSDHFLLGTEARVENRGDLGGLKQCLIHQKHNNEISGLSPLTSIHLQDSNLVLVAGGQHSQIYRFHENDLNIIPAASSPSGKDELYCNKDLSIDLAIITAYKPDEPGYTLNYQGSDYSKFSGDLRCYAKKAEETWNIADLNTQKIADFVNVQLIELWDVNTAEVKNPTAKMGGPSFGIYDFRAGQSSLIQSELQADGHNGYNLGIERLGFSRRQIPSLSSFLPDLQIIKTINHWDEDPVLNPV